MYFVGPATGGETLSKHLKSRIETGHVLRESGVPVTEFRASVVIGSGSLSFELIRALVERLPIMICPRWGQKASTPGYSTCIARTPAFFPWVPRAPR